MSLWCLQGCQKILCVIVMEIKEQLTSLSLSKRFKQLGVKQNSIHAWKEKISMKGVSTWILYNKYNIFVKDKNYSAFSVAELGEILPQLLETDNKTCTLEIYKLANDTWGVVYVQVFSKLEILLEESKTLADAMAKMLIYLLENKLMKL